MLSSTQNSADAQKSNEDVSFRLVRAQRLWQPALKLEAGGNRLLPRQTVEHVAQMETSSLVGTISGGRKLLQVERPVLNGRMTHTAPFMALKVQYIGVESASAPPYQPQTSPTHARLWARHAVECGETS